MLLAGFGLGFLFQSFDFFAINNNPEEIPEFDNPIGLAIGGFAMFIFYMLAFIMMCTISVRYVQLYKERASIASLQPVDIWNESKSNIGWMTGYFLFFIIAILVLYIGAILLCVGISQISGFLLIPIIPLLICGIMYLLIGCMFVIPLKMEEQDLGIFEAVKKSLQVIKNNWWRSFGFVIVFNFLLSIVSYVFIIPLYAIIFGMALVEQSVVSKFLSGVGVGVSYGLAMLTTSFMYIAISILFYSLYENHTGENLMEQIDSIGSGGDLNTVESI